MGDNATILYDENIPPRIKKMVTEQGREAGGPWDCFDAASYYGWEADRVVVVVVTGGGHLFEMMTRARVQLAVLLVGEDGKEEESIEFREYFQ